MLYNTIGPCWLSILIYQCVYDRPKVPNFPLPLATMSSLYKSVSLFLFCEYANLYHLFLDSTYIGYHMMFLLLSLTYFTQYDTPSMLWQMALSILFNGSQPTGWEKIFANDVTDEITFKNV